MFFVTPSGDGWTGNAPGLWQSKVARGERDIEFMFAQRGLSADLARNTEREKAGCSSEEVINGN